MIHGDFVDNLENIDPTTVPQYKMSLQDGDSGFSLTSDSTSAGPDIASDEFRPASEVFKDPNAFDFLSQHGGPEATVSQLARESLYVRFDPLVGGRPSVMNTVQNPSNGEPSGPPSSTADDLIKMSSPSPRKPTKKTSIKITSDNNSETIEQSSKPAPPNPTTTAATMPPSNDTNNRDLDSEQVLEFQETLLKKDKNLSDLKKSLDSKTHEIEQLKKDLKLKQDSETQMKEVLKEYEKTISELIAEKEREKERFSEERRILESERNQAVEDLQNVEAAFADVHRKYERTKQVVEGFKQNEETLKRYVEEYAQKLKQQDQRYDLLKSHAEETLEKANREIDTLAKSQDAEMARLSALLKKTEMKATSLERTVEQKAKENEELTAICDELIAKVGK